MKLKKIEYQSCIFDLKQNFSNAKNQYANKEIVIIKIYVSQSLIGYGEASPLQGFSKESFQEIIWGLESFIAGIDFNCDYSIDEFFNLISIHCEKLPSLHFGLDTAMYDLLSKIQETSISKLLSKQNANTVSFSNIYIKKNNIPINKNNILKYKLGINNTNEDIKNIKKLLSSNPLIKFRFDANQNYILADFIRIVNELKQFEIDYFEEPITKPSNKKLKDLKSELDIKIAIDESLYNGSNYISWIENNLIDIVIIKPSIWGSYKKFFQLSNFCKKHHVKMILSSALENNIGNMATIHLAASINNQLAHGLNIHNFYDNFIYSPMYKENDSHINIENIIGLGI